MTTEIGRVLRPDAFAPPVVQALAVHAEKALLELSHKDTPPGRFQLELAISADGTVDRIVPLCEAQLCPAAGVYAELVSHWRFQPGDLAGEASPSRLRLEFEVGLPAEADAADDQAPRQ